MRDKTQDEIINAIAKIFTAPPEVVILEIGTNDSVDGKTVRRRDKNGVLRVVSRTPREG